MAKSLLSTLLDRVEALSAISVDPCDTLSSVTAHRLELPEIGSWFRVVLAVDEIEIATVESDGGPYSLRWIPIAGVDEDELDEHRQAIGQAVLLQLDLLTMEPDEASDMMICGMAACAERLSAPPNGLQALLSYRVIDGELRLPTDTDTDDYEDDSHVPLR